jgi:hypothetical protein
MKRNEALPSQFLGKEDFPTETLCQVANVAIETVKTERGEEKRPVLYIMGPSRNVDVSRGIILNGTNWDTLEEITGEPDSDDWAETRIVVYVDPNVKFGSKRVGGIRIRAPKQAPPAAPRQKPTRPADPEPEYDEQNPPPADDSDSPF